MSGHKIGTASLLKKYIVDVFPMVDKELKTWRGRALSCPDTNLRLQALSSIDNKGFHARGGSVFSLYPGVDTPTMVKLIVAYQTISDYLDNLCDRAGCQDEKAFSYLHLAMTDALECTVITHDYYKYYPWNDDGGYLLSLVKTCKDQVMKLPGYNLVKEDVLYLAKLYSCLQTYKHLSLDIREKKMFQWTKVHIENFENILPWEFWAATGSTLGIFMLFAASSTQTLTPCEIKMIREAYFPWICALHILLDYFIDYNEDLENGDLNFVRYYKSTGELEERLMHFIRGSFLKAASLHYPDFHAIVVKGLLAMYLSDGKAMSSNLIGTTKYIISSQDIKLKLMHKLCKHLRNKKII